MHLERLILAGFRCFGAEPVAIPLSAGLTTFIGANGAGKTAVMQALQRLFGISAEQRRLRRQDFHIPSTEAATPAQRELWLEAILAFPELDDPQADQVAVPEFFRHLAADEDGRLKCRLRLQATWIDDGSLDGLIEQKFWAIPTFDATYAESDCHELSGLDRTRIQLIYVPAARDGASQVTAFLRGRLWRAIQWTEQVREAFATTGDALNTAFAEEAAIARIASAVTQRWQQVHSAGTDAVPVFRPVDLRFQEFIRKVEIVFRPDEAGGDRGVEDLSDGQRSLFHLAMTAATLDVEAQVARNPDIAGFLPDSVVLPALTLIAIEEPENHLAPYYLSRIIRQLEDLARGQHAQALVSSHSASILARVDPEQVRHFRLDLPSRTSRVRAIQLPAAQEEAAKYVREAVHAYPELYFARFVVLGEGASEEVVLPRLAEAMGLDIDRSFVAMVPLGGRHVNHLWRLLNDLDIPHATLLDLDWGRAGGGWGRIKNVCRQLLEIGKRPEEVFGRVLRAAGPDATLEAIDLFPAENIENIDIWIRWLRNLNVFFCRPLDLDYSMLQAMPDAYQTLEAGMQGPSPHGDPRDAVLGEDSHPEFYGAADEDPLRWYRYLFLGRGKPSTHVRVLSRLPANDLANQAPEELRALLLAIADRLQSRA